MTRGIGIAAFRGLDILSAHKQVPLSSSFRRECDRGLDKRVGEALGTGSKLSMTGNVISDLRFVAVYLICGV